MSICRARLWTCLMHCSAFQRLWLWYVVSGNAIDLPHRLLAQTNGQTSVRRLHRNVLAEAVHLCRNLWRCIVDWSHRLRLHPLTFDFFGDRAAMPWCERGSVRFGFISEGRRNAERCSTDVDEMTTRNGISKDALRRAFTSLCSIYKCIDVSPSQPPSVVPRLNGVPRNSISSWPHAWSSPVAVEVSSFLRRRPPAFLHHVTLRRRLWLSEVWRYGNSDGSRGRDRHADMITFSIWPQDHTVGWVIWPVKTRPRYDL